MNKNDRNQIEKEEELNYYRKKHEEITKKSPNKINNQYFEDENKFLQQEKKNLEGKIMNLLQENEGMKKKFDGVLQDFKKKPEIDVFYYKFRNFIVKLTFFFEKLLGQFKEACDKITNLEEKLQNSEREKQKLIGLMGEKQRENEILESKLNLSEQLKEKEMNDLKRLIDRGNQVNSKKNYFLCFEKLLFFFFITVKQKLRFFFTKKKSFLFSLKNSKFFHH